MGKRIAIAGGGAAGLHLGLYLLARDIDVTIHTDRRPEDYPKQRLINTVAHHSITIARENELGVNHWPTDQFGYYCHYHHFGGEQPIFFRGDFKSASRAVDYRIYLPRLMQDFTDRGGRIEYAELKADDVGRLAASADLVVVCTGKGPLGQMFQHDAAHSPFGRPQRMLCVGLYQGVAEEPTRSVTLSEDDAAVEALAQRQPGQAFHRDVDVTVAARADVVNGDDVGMIQSPGRHRLVNETRAEVRLAGPLEREHLERDLASDQRILGPIHRTHRAAAQCGADDIAANRARIAG
jgi:hypothetical protein